MKKLLEIATTDFISTRNAVEGGADRIELCSALELGGLTPGYGLMYRCKEAFDLPIFPMLRPRAGDFMYDEEEFEVMCRDLQMMKSMGFEGVVAGLLLSDGSIDLARTSRLIEKAWPMEFTFHRAFDRCRDPFQALEQLEQIGCTRILTSGQQPSATQGVNLIRQLQENANLIIMPGAGIRKENIAKMAVETGCSEFHTAARSVKESEMHFIPASFETENYATIRSEDVQKIKKELDEA